MSGYTKLFGSILDSTVWELPHTTVRVWVTLMAMADRHGEVQASVPGLAHRSRVTLEETKKALDAFLSPDEYSRTPDQEGRRIEPIDGGWRLINHEKYTRMMSEEDRRARGAERQARYVASKKRQQPSAGVSECQKRQNDDTQTEIKTETKTNSDRIPPAPREKAPSAKREPSGEPGQFEKALADFGKPWAGRYHRPYMPTAADRNQLGRFWQKSLDWQRAQWPHICARYLSRTDEFFAQKTNSHSLQWLVLKGLNEFTGPPPPSKEALAAAELRRHQAVRAAEKRAGPDDLGGAIGQLALAKGIQSEKTDDERRAEIAAQFRARGVT